MKDQVAQPVLTDEQTLEEVIDCLAEHIPIDTQGACSQTTIYEILVRAACNKDSIENTCKILQDAPCGNDIRYHLDKFRSIDQMETNINNMLHHNLPSSLIKHGKCIATDFNLIPYYGEPSKEEKPYIYRSQAKDGTCSFFAYATLYVIKKNKRFTIAITLVRVDDTTVAVITRLLDKIHHLKITIKRLYLDRGYFSVPVIRWLIALGIPFEMPVIVRGKKGGTRQLIKGRKSYCTTYTLNSKEYGSVTFPVHVICTYSNGERGKHKVEHFLYVVYKVNLRLRSVHDDYRRRFGIETSYRLKNECRIKTTTKNPIIRLLYIGIAFIIINIWIYLLLAFISKPRKGGRIVFHGKFCLKIMLVFLTQAIDRKRHPITAIYLE